MRYPGAVVDPDTGELISAAQVAEVEFTAFAGTRYETTGRLVVRRVLDAHSQDPLFPVRRYHPFFTNSTEPVDQADITHGQHAICETVWSNLIDGPWAHQPSGTFPTNAAWSILAATCHNLLRAAGTLTRAARYAADRYATLRAHLVNIPARLARPQRRPVLHLPAHWPRAKPWLRLWRAVVRHITPSHPPHAPRCTTTTSATHRPPQQGKTLDTRASVPSRHHQRPETDTGKKKNPGSRSTDSG